ncbi:MAG: type III-A CRISPR-associated RAMP protein Csm4 [Prevotellaceae bacterium]|jgi:CRISPR-associated protein Csm4|nr:type III-A CRISPR-associated RAMP protein Csm4 [Prevotellaceae bacterium]
MQAIILKSGAGTRFHFGEVLGSAEGKNANAQQAISSILHSDTLFSAIVNAWALRNPETVDSFIAACRSNEFKISSGFYCLKTGERTVFFLPKPVSLNLCTANDPKALKRVKMISVGVWEKGLLPDDWLDKNKCTLLQNNTIVALKEEVNENMKLYELQTSPKIKARTENREDSFFWQTNLHLLSDENHTVNWYFIVENKLNDALNNHLTDALQTLMHLGIGGERSSGCGSLTDFEKLNFSLNLPDTQPYHASISLVIPKKDELSDNCFYLTVKRGGRYFDNNEHLKMVQALIEGAVFEKNIQGQIVALKEQPLVLRYGLSLTLPLHDNFVNNLI